MGCVPFHIGLLLWESASCGIPQSKIKDFCQLPLTREPCGVPPLSIPHGNLLRIVTAPPAPGNVTLQKGSVNTSLREGGGLGRSPKTEGAIGSMAGWIAREGTSPKLSHF